VPGPHGAAARDRNVFWSGSAGQMRPVPGPHSEYPRFPRFLFFVRWAAFAQSRPVPGQHFAACAALAGSAAPAGPAHMLRAVTKTEIINAFLSIGSIPSLLRASNKVIYLSPSACNRRGTVNKTSALSSDYNSISAKLVYCLSQTRDPASRGL
jgi:hypothetical protein